MTSVFFILSILSYLLAFLGRAVEWRRAELASRVSLASLWVGLALHLSGLLSNAVALGELPFRGPSGSMASVSAMVVAGFLWTRRNPKAEAVGSFVVPLAIVLLALGLLLPSEVEGTLAPGGDIWFPVHALMILVGLGGFGLAFGVSLLYLVVRWRLKSKRLLQLSKMPSLETLDGLNTRFILLGFGALTVGIAAGAIWATTLPERPAMGPAVYASLLLWVWYAAAIQVRVVGGWRGLMAAGFSVIGFIGLVLGLFGILIAIQGWHP